MAGAALAFQGNTELVALRTLLKQSPELESLAVQPPYPTVDTGMTVSIWFLLSPGVSTNKSGRWTLVGDTATFVLMIAAYPGTKEGVAQIGVFLNLVEIRVEVPNAAIHDGEWHGFTVTSDNLSPSSQVTMYLDGLVILVKTEPGTQLDFSDLVGLTLGSRTDLSDPHHVSFNEALDGAVDDLAINKRALTGAEVAATWNQAKEVGIDDDLVM